MKKENGYYWIRMENFYNEWQPARWDGEDWQVIGAEEEYSGTDITEIGERIREPQGSIKKGKYYRFV